MAMLEVKGLSKRYGGLLANNDISFAVDEGRILGVIGPNGAGKSTLFDLITGYQPPDAGEVFFAGKSLRGLRPDQINRLGVGRTFQKLKPFTDMTVEENMLMGGFLKDKPSQAWEAAENVLQKYTRLSERRKQKAGVLSGGERRLLEISRALIMEPEVLLVDEPSIGLEPRFIQMVFEILDDLQNKEGKTIVMVEQNAKKGLEFADIGYVLVSGYLAMAGTGDELLENPEVGRLFLGG